MIWRPGEPTVRSITTSDLGYALNRGIDDFRAMPTHTLFLAAAYPIIGLILYQVIFNYDLMQLAFPLIAGLALLGPLAAIGLYELSRRRERGLEVKPADALTVFQSPSIGAILKLALVLLAIFFAWLMTAHLLYQSTMTGPQPATFSEFVSQLTTTPEGRELMVTGNLIGLAFAILVLMISVVSFPMLIDRNVSAGTAVRTSIRAVLESPVTMALWGLFVALSLLLGALPMFIGLAVVLPVLGHATWHLYRRVVVD